MASPPLQGKLVFVQLGIDAAAQPVYLPRVDQVAASSHGNATAAAGCRTTYLGHELIWTGQFTAKGRPHSQVSRIRPISRLISAGLTTVQDCLGQQWFWIQQRTEGVRSRLEKSSGELNSGTAKS